MQFRKHDSGKSHPITSKKIRDLSDDDVSINVDIDNEDELDEFAENTKDEFITEKFHNKKLKNPYGGRVYTEKQLNHMMDEMIKNSNDPKQIEALKKLMF